MNHVRGYSLAILFSIVVTAPVSLPVQAIDNMSAQDLDQLFSEINDAPQPNPALPPANQSPPVENFEPAQPVSSVPSPSSLSPQRQADQALIQGLSENDLEDMIRMQLGDGLTPSEIKRVKEAVREYREATEHTRPPKTSSDIIQVRPGESVDLVVMQDYPVTLMLADQYGDPLLIDYHDVGASSVIEVREMKRYRNDEMVVDGLRIHALDPLRSTTLTLLADETRLPINLTVRTVAPSSDKEITVLNELRLDWVTRLDSAQVTAGRYAAPDIRQKADAVMMAVVTGRLNPADDDAMHHIELEGRIHSDLFVDESTGFWFLRLPIDAQPLNINIESQTTSAINGYRAFRMTEKPPKVIRVALNGQRHNLVTRIDRSLDHVIQ